MLSDLKVFQRYSLYTIYIKTEKFNCQEQFQMKQEKIEVKSAGTSRPCRGGGQGGLSRLCWGRNYCLGCTVFSDL